MRKGRSEDLPSPSNTKDSTKVLALKRVGGSSSLGWAFLSADYYAEHYKSLVRYLAFTVRCEPFYFVSYLKEFYGLLGKHFRGEDFIRIRVGKRDEMNFNYVKAIAESVLKRKVLNSELGYLLLGYEFYKKGFIFLDSKFTNELHLIMEKPKCYLRVGTEMRPMTVLGWDKSYDVGDWVHSCLQAKSFAVEPFVLYGFLDGKAKTFKLRVVPYVLDSLNEPSLHFSDTVWRFHVLEVE